MHNVNLLYELYYYIDVYIARSYMFRRYTRLHQGAPCS